MSKEIVRAGAPDELPKDLRAYLPAVVAGLAELPLVGLLAKIPNEAWKQFSADRSEKEQRALIARLFEIGQQTNEDIAVLGAWAAGTFALHAELLSVLRSRGMGIEGEQLGAFARMTALVAYRSSVAREFQYADHRGIEGATRAAHVTSLELDEIYVMPHLVAERDRTSLRERERELLRRLTREADFTPQERARVEEEYAVLTGERWGGEKRGIEGSPLGAALLAERHAVVIGSPGVGKSTLSRYLARVCALGGDAVHTRLGWNESPLPVLLPLALFAEERRRRPGLALHDFIAQRMRERGGGALVEAVMGALEDGSALIILDGVDEVPESHARAAVVQAVDDLIAGHGQNRIIVTSRPFGYIPVRGDVPHFQLPNFTPDQVKEFVFKWQRAGEIKQHPGAPNFQNAEMEARSLIEELKRNSKVAELAANPLMLVIVSLIRYEKARLPEERVQLYNRAVNTLMDTWNQWRSLPGKDVGGVTLPLDRLVRVWGTIAEWTRRTNNTGIMHRTELKNRLVEVLQQREYDEEDAEATAESYLRAAADRAGVLEERGTNIFAFWHPTFEEFLAAVELATPTGEAARRLVPLADDPRWREVVLLAVGYVGVVQRDGKTASGIVEALMDDSLPVHEPLTHSRLLLAAACIADDVGARRTTAQRVIQQLAAAVRTYPYRPLISAFVKIVRSLPRVRPEKPLIAALETLTTHPSWEIRMEAARLLANAAATDPDGFRLCSALLYDADKNVQCHAALGLARAGVHTAESWAALRTFADPFAQVESAVRDFLVGAGEETLVSLMRFFEGLGARNRADHLALVRAVAAEEQAVRTLAGAMESEDPWRVVLAGRLLREAGYTGTAFTCRVVPLAFASDPVIRGESADLLRQQPELPEAAIKGLVAGLATPDPLARLDLVVLLRRLGYAGGELQDALVQLLESSEQGVWTEARGLLAQLPRAEGLVSALVERMQIASPRARLRIGSLLRHWECEPDELARAMAPLLQNDDPGVRAAAAGFLRELPHSAALVAAIAAQVGTEIPAALLLIAELLWQTSYRGEEVAMALAPLLLHEDQTVRTDASRLLEKLPVPARLGQTLVPHLESATPLSRIQIARVLRRAGYTGPELVEALAPLLDHPSDMIPNEAQQLLSGLPRSQPLIDRLVPSLAVRDAGARRAATRLLCGIGYEGPELDSALADLAEGGTDDADVVRFLARLPPSPPVAEALGRLLGSQTPEVRAEAARALVKMPRFARAAPLLLRALALGNVDVRADVARLISETDYTCETGARLAELLTGGDAGVTVDAARLLHQFGSPPRPLIDALQPLLEDPEAEARLGSALLLHELGYDVDALVPTLVALLGNESGAIHREASKRLADLPPTPSLIRALLGCIADRDSSAAGRALALLARMPSAPEFVDACAELLRSEDSQVRIRAATLLASVGFEGVELFRQIGSLVGDADRTVRATATKLMRDALPRLKEIRGNAGATPVRGIRGVLTRLQARYQRPQPDAYQAAVDALEEVLEEGRPNVRIEAARLLREADHRSPALARSLVPLLEEADPAIRSYALRLLREAPRGEILPALLPLIRTPNHAARIEILKLLGSLDYRGPDIAGVLLETVRDGSGSAKLEAAVLLRGMGHDSRSIPATLVDLLEAQDFAVRSAALRFLNQLPPADVPAPELLAAISRIDPGVRVEVARLLCSAGHTGEALEQGLVSLLPSRDPLVSSEAAKLLVSRPPSSTIPGLLSPLLSHEDPSVRLTTARLMKWAGDTGEAVRTSLVRLMSEDDSEIRHAAGGVLASMLSREEFYTNVEPLLDVDDDQVRILACTFLCDTGCSGESLDSTLASLLGANDYLIRESARELIGVTPQTDVRVSKILQLAASVPAPRGWTVDSFPGLWDAAGGATIDVLAAQIASADADVRVRAIEWIRKVPRSGTLFTRLAPLLGSATVPTRVVTARLLHEFGWFDEQLERTLLLLLATDDAGARDAAARLLTTVPRSPALHASLRELLGARQPEVRLAAAGLLLEFGTPADRLVPDLLALLRCDAPHVRLGASRLLIGIRHVDEVVVGALMGLCEVADMDLRFGAHELLQQLEPSESLTAVLVGFLDGGDLRVRATAAGLLREWNQSDELSVLALAALLRADDEWLQEQITDLLDEWGPSEVLVSALLPLLDTDNLNVRLNAMHLLRRQRQSPGVLRAMLRLSGADDSQAELILSGAGDTPLLGSPERIAVLADLARSRETDDPLQHAARAWVYEWLIDHTENTESLPLAA
ncbi:MAG TPA: HEAT repeat domain-containing protein [Longimicrobium sp.]|jgi:hypothetical protein